MIFWMEAYLINHKKSHCFLFIAAMMYEESSIFTQMLASIRAFPMVLVQMLARMGISTIRSAGMFCRIP